MFRSLRWWENMNVPADSVTLLLISVIPLLISVSVRVNLQEATV